MPMFRSYPELKRVYMCIREAGPGGLMRGMKDIRLGNSIQQRSGIAGDTLMRCLATLEYLDLIVRVKSQYGRRNLYIASRYAGVPRNLMDALRIWFIKYPNLTRSEWYAMVRKYEIQ